MCRKGGCVSAMSAYSNSLGLVEDEDSYRRMATALSLITPPTHSCPRPCYQGWVLKQAFLLGTRVNNQKQMCSPSNKFAYTVCTCKHSVGLLVHLETQTVPPLEERAKIHVKIKTVLVGFTSLRSLVMDARLNKRIKAVFSCFLNIPAQPTGY